MDVYEENFVVGQQAEMTMETNITSATNTSSMAVTGGAGEYYIATNNRSWGIKQSNAYCLNRNFAWANVLIVKFVSSFKE